MVFPSKLFIYLPQFNKQNINSNTVRYITFITFHIFCTSLYHIAFYKFSSFLIYYKMVQMWTFVLQQCSIYLYNEYGNNMLVISELIPWFLLVVSLNGSVLCSSKFPKKIVKQFLTILLTKIPLLSFEKERSRYSLQFNNIF